MKDRNQKILIKTSLYAILFVSLVIYIALVTTKISNDSEKITEYLEQQMETREVKSNISFIEDTSLIIKNAQYNPSYSDIENAKDKTCLLDSYGRPSSAYVMLRNADIEDIPILYKAMPINYSTYEDVRFDNNIVFTPSYLIDNILQGNDSNDNAVAYTEEFYENIYSPVRDNIISWLKESPKNQILLKVEASYLEDANCIPSKIIINYYSVSDSGQSFNTSLHCKNGLSNANINYSTGNVK